MRCVFIKEYKKIPAAGKAAGIFLSDLFNVFVIVDVIFTVAVVTVALGAVAELQLGICHIGPV